MRLKMSRRSSVPIAAEIFQMFKRFNISTYIPHLRLDTEEGLDILARQIDNILTVDDNE